MRIVTWNCNMAFDRKYEALLRLRPDIAVVQECAKPDILFSKAPVFTPSTFDWVGHADHKGMAVFAFGDYGLSRRSEYDPAIRHVLPLAVTGPHDFNLLAVWAFMDGKYMTGRHDPGPLNNACERYHGHLRSGDAMMAGDFNNHPKWDKPGHARNFAALTERLLHFGLESAYHRTAGLEHGHEALPTHYWRDRKEDSPFNCHIDYAFVPQRLLNGARVEIGSYAEWCGNGLSDHVPLILDVAWP
jgi:exodeoxyribonuclease III